MQRGVMANTSRLSVDAEVVNLAEREKLKRVRRGECPECGTRLFQKMPLGRKGPPLSEEGKCQNGNCLVCSPQPQGEQGKDKPKVPQVVECVNSSWMTSGRIPESEDQAFGMFQQSEDDNMSVITLDKRLVTPESEPGSSRSLLLTSRRALLKTKSSTRDIIEEQDPADSDNEEMEGELLARMAMLLEVDNDDALPSADDTRATENKTDVFGNIGDTSPSKLSKSTVVAPSHASLVGVSPTKRPFRPPAVFVPQSVEEVRLNDDPREIVLDRPPAPDKPTPTPATATVTVVKVGVKKDPKEAPREFSLQGSGNYHERHVATIQPDVAANHSESTGGKAGSKEEDVEEYSEYSNKLLEMLGNFIESDDKHVTPQSQAVSTKKPPPSSIISGGGEAASGSTTPIELSLSDLDCPVKPISICSVDKVHKKSPGRKKPPPSSRPGKGPKSPNSSSVTLNLDLDDPASTDLILLLGRLEHGRHDDHTCALTQLAEHIWEHGPAAKDDFVTNDGTKLLTAIMWSDMTQPDSEHAACEVFLALTATHPRASVDTHALDKFLTDPHLEGLLDALLIVMQTFLADRSIQQTGCRILAGLAACRNEIDGTRSGACLAVLNAMEAHMSSMILQECGLRTLFNQCVYSKHAETNKRTLLATRLEASGAFGSAFVERIVLESMSFEAQLGPGSLLEWVCRLYWCLLASSESVAELIVLRIDTMRKLLHVLESCRVAEVASPELQEAILGILANRVRHAQYGSFLATTDVLLLVLDVMHENKTSLGVQVEACNLFANVTMRVSSVEKDRLVSSGSVRTLVGAMFAFPNEKRVLQEPCLRAIVGLSLDSELAKKTLCEPDTLSVLLRLCKLDESSLPQQQELLCSLLASLYASPRLQQSALAFESFRSVAAAASKYINSEKLQDAACSAYLNLTTNHPILSHLRHTGIERLIVTAMNAFRMSKSIQIKGSCALLQICLGDDYFDDLLNDSGAIDAVVAAIQTHLDSYDVLESACEALWGLIHSSPSLGRQFLSNETVIETVTCIFVMHPRSTTLIEKACGILAFASSTVSMSSTAPVLAEGVTNIVEAIRRNPLNDGILINGTYYLRRALVRSPSFVADLRGIIPFVVDALRDSSQTDLFIKEACSLLGFAAHVSFEAKSHILSLDTHSLLTTIMEYRGGSEIVNRSVSEALAELSHDTRGPPSHY